VQEAIAEGVERRSRPNTGATDGTTGSFGARSLTGGSDTGASARSGPRPPPGRPRQSMTDGGPSTGERPRSVAFSDHVISSPPHSPDRGKRPPLQPGPPGDSPYSVQPYEIK
jgi:hypothetical protein